MKKSLKHLSQNKQDELQKIVATIQKSCKDVEKIILFGSYARGDYKEKEELKAPSANTLRKKFGNLKAAKNTSDKKLTPINLAIIISLINPKIRDIEIKNAMIKADLKRVIGD